MALDQNAYLNVGYRDSLRDTMLRHVNPGAPFMGQNADFNKMQPVSEVTRFFGTPQDWNYLPQYDRFERNYQLPWAYRNKSVFLGSYLTGLIGLDLSDWILTASDGIPIVETDQKKFKWTQIKFDTPLLQNIPEEGPGRLIRHGWEEFEASTHRKGLGMYVEHDFFLTPEGQHDFVLCLQQMQNGCQLTMSQMTLDRFCQCRNRHFKHLVQQGRYNLNFERLAEDKAREFAAAQKSSHALNQVVYRAINEMRLRQKEPSVLITDQSGAMFFSGAGVEKTTFLEAGPAGPSRLLKNPQEVKVFQGLRLRWTRVHKGKDGLQWNPLIRNKEIGEFARAFGQKPNKLTQEYQSWHRDIRLYDMQKDEMFTVSMNQLIKNSHVFSDQPFNDTGLHFPVGFSADGVRRIGPNGGSLNNLFDTYFSGNRVGHAACFGEMHREWMPNELITAMARILMRRSVAHRYRLFHIVRSLFGGDDNSVIQNAHGQLELNVRLNARQGQNTITNGINVIRRRGMDLVRGSVKADKFYVGYHETAGVVPQQQQQQASASASSAPPSTETANLNKENANLLEKADPLIASNYAKVLPVIQEAAHRDLFISKVNSSLNRGGDTEINNLRATLSTLNEHIASGTKTSKARFQAGIVDFIGADAASVAIPATTTTTTTTGATSSSSASAPPMVQIFHASEIDPERFVPISPLTNQPAASFDEAVLENQTPHNMFNQLLGLIKRTSGSHEGIGAFEGPARMEWVPRDAREERQSPEWQYHVQTTAGVTDPAYLLSLYLILLAPICQETFDLFFDADVPIPIGAIIFRPYIRLKTCSGLVLKPGRELGFFALGKGDMMFGDDPEIKAHQLFYTVNLGVIIQDELNIYYLDDLWVTNYLNGMNRVFFTREDLEDLKQHGYDNAREPNAPSNIVMLTPYRIDNLPNVLDIRGRLPGSDPNDPLPYVVAQSNREDFPEAVGGANHPFDPSPNPAVHNTICMQGHQEVYNPWQKNMSGVILGRSYLGKNIYPGVKDVLELRNGARDGVMQEQNYHLRVVGDE